MKDYQLWTRTCALGVLILLLAGCADSRNVATPLSGRVLLWHSLDERGAAALEESVATFSEINPAIQVKTQTFPTEKEMMNIFLRSADSGLGPDLMLTSSEWVLSLAQDEIIRNVRSYVTADEEDRYMPAALASVEYGQKLYGLPLVSVTEVLYYNGDMVDGPAATLDALIADAAAGNSVAMNSDFKDAFWGVQAFGGRLFNNDGAVILGQGGYTNWLEWLKAARDMPGVILDPDQEFLAQQFNDGAVAYYVGKSTELSALVDAVGSSLRVTQLPKGPVGSAGPFLTSQAFVFSSASSSTQTDIAVELAKFITNTEQSAMLMRVASLVPSNRNVRINQRLNPLASAIAEQARNAVPLPNVDRRDEVIEMASSAQTRVLEGVLTATEAAITTAAAIGEELGLPVEEPTPTGCDLVGRLTIANTLAGAVSDVVKAQTEAYNRDCPSMTIDVVDISASTLNEQATKGGMPYLGYALILGNQRLLTQLADNGNILEISPWVDGERLQSYAPQSISAARMQSGLYAVPLAMDLNALYYNHDLVEQPARNLDELRRQGQDGTPLVLEADFRNAFWGISAFGTQPPTAGFGVSLDADGLASWLEWLRDAQNDARISIAFNHEAAKQSFVDGEAAYFVGSLSEFSDLVREMSADVVDAETLPSGPGGDASPLLTIVGFMLPAHVRDDDIELIRGYLQYIGSPENQRELAELAGVVPVNSSTDLSDMPVVSVFAEQMRTATVTPNVADIGDILRIGDQLFDTLLTESVDLREAAMNTVQLLSAALEMEPVETPQASP